MAGHWMSRMSVLILTIGCSAAFGHQRMVPLDNSCEVATAYRDYQYRTSVSDTAYVIPIVIHIVYHTDQQNIPDTRVYEQLKVLNDDFRRKNADAVDTDIAFESLAADTKIMFELAKTDTSGNSTSGITRTQTSQAVFADNRLHRTSAGGVDSWDTTKYLNVWVAPLAPGILGYASHPENTNEFEGIAIHFENFGTSDTAKPPYHLGRTLTHEVGHYLGLHHLWGTGGCLSDDGVSDTPLQEKSTIGCSLEQQSCGSKDMVQNYMNLADDDCLNFFTIGQSEVMRASLTTYYSQLFSKKTTTVTHSDVVVDKKYIYTVQRGTKTYIYLHQINDKGELYLVNSTGSARRKQYIHQPSRPIPIDRNRYTSGIYIAYYQTQESIYSTKIILKE